MLTRYPLEKFVNGKSVVIVGPSVSVVGCNLGRLIDSYDVVCRMNQALPVPARLRGDIGTRTDVLFHTFNESAENAGPIAPDMWVREGVKLISMVFPTRPFYNDIDKFKAKAAQTSLFYHIMNEGKYNDVAEVIGKQLHSGFSALVDLWKSNLYCLFIVGFTFHRDGVYSEYKPMFPDRKSIAAWEAVNKVHNGERELEFFIDIVYRDKRIFADKALLNVMEDWKRGRCSEESEPF